MKKQLLFAATMAALAFSGSAENKIYWFTADATGSEYDMMGTVMSVSENGEYAIINDDEMQQCYLWRKADPTKLEILNWLEGGKEVKLDMYAVNDAGTIVGAYLPTTSNQYLPFVKELDAERVELPLPTWALNTNFAQLISNDGKVIGGQLGKSIKSKTIEKDGEPDTWGGYWPALWVKGDDGEYVLEVNEDMDMPDNQGFFPTVMYTDGTVDGTYLGGTVGAGAGAFLPAVYNKGELKLWNKLEIVTIPFMYKGEPMGYYKYETIDGKMDMHHSYTDIVNAQIYSGDREGHFFGTRFHVGDLPYNDNVENDLYGQSEGDYYTWGYYDVKTGEWTDIEGSKVVSAALSEKVFFSNTEIYEEGIEGPSSSIESKLDIDTNGVDFRGVASASLTGNVLGLSYTTVDAIGVFHAHPFIAVLDKGVVGIDDIAVDPLQKVVVLAYNSTIEVQGAKEVAVYDLNGTFVSKTATTNVAGGAYVVVADGKSHKVIVR